MYRPTDDPRRFAATSPIWNSLSCGVQVRYGKPRTGHDTRTGNIDCTTSLTIPPAKKQTNPVKMTGEQRQNHILRASLAGDVSENRYKNKVNEVRTLPHQR